MNHVEQPLFDIVIPSYGRPEKLLAGLERVAQAWRPGLHLGQVVVVENGERFGVERICSSMEDKLPIRYVYQSEASASLARDAGVNACSAPFIVFFDNDIQIDPDTLRAYQSAFVRFGDSRFYGGKLYPIYEKEPAPWIRAFLPFSVRGFSLGESEQECAHPQFLGGNFAVPRRWYRQVGGFEGPSASGTKGGGVGEEVRLQKAMLDAGITGLFLPDASVGHPVPASAVTESFVLHRFWRHGYTEGVLGGQEATRSGYFLKAPKWVWSRMLKSTLRLGSNLNPLKQKPEKLREKIEFFKLLGVIAGYRSIDQPARAGAAKIREKVE